MPYDYVLEGQVKEGDVRGFHPSGGLCFIREKDGTVRVTQTGITLATIDSYTWASVIASMSDGGEDASSYEVARNFHGCYSLIRS